MTVRRRLLYVLLALFTLAAVGAVGGAVGASLTGDVDGVDGTTQGYRGIPRVTRVVYNDTNWQTGSLTFTPVPGMSLKHYIPAGVDDVLLIDVSAFTRCHDTSAGVDALCEIRVLVDGVEANPAAGTVFDSAQDGNGGDAWEAHSFQFVTKRAWTGNHTIELQYRVDQVGATFFMDNITMSVQAARTW
jgi:hypothetical protein